MRRWADDVTIEDVYQHYLLGSCSYAEYVNKTNEILARIEQQIKEAN